MDDIDAYASKLDPRLGELCGKLRATIDRGLAGGASRLYHGAPVWFIGENPIVGYSLKKGRIALLFWSGASFEEGGLTPVGKYKAAEISYADSGEIDGGRLAKWLRESMSIIWDYPSLRKTGGILERL
jgi:hypothetical protein